MNILVIGNGFDLAHGFPTTYKNFLEFTDVFKRYISICKKEEIEPEEIHIKDREKVMFLHDLNKREQNIFEELENLLIDNIWINYFWEIYEARISIEKDGWIDFENEISKVVQTIDKVNREIQKSKREESEIKDISFYEKQLFESIELNINKVIGDGIDEYLLGEEKRTNNEFIEFKKFYQRIYKKTGCIYTDWVKNICEEQSVMRKARLPKNNVYIIGHSLDITDGDILKALINMPNTKTTIFYHTKEAFGKQISNLVKILGEDELISKVHGSDASIIFREQMGYRVCKRLPLRLG